MGVLCAQQPSYQEVGAEYLEGKDIYGLLEDTEGILWIGTDEGVYAYDGVAFKPYHNSQLKNRSVFCLRQDSKGTIYYFNFAGQIMRIVQDSLEVFYELPDSLKGHGMDIAIDSEDNVIVNCNYFLKIDSQRQIQLLRPINYGYGGNIFKDSSGGLKYLDGRVDLWLYWKDGVLEVDSMHVINREEGDFYKLTNSSGAKIIIEGSGAEFLKEEGTSWRKVEIPFPGILKGGQACVSSTFDGVYYWCSCWDGGAYRYHVANETLNPARLLVDYTISHHYPQQGQKWWLGTLKKGILNIPNAQLLEFSNHDFLTSNTTTAITAGRGDTLYGLTQKGILYRLDPDHKVTVLTTSQTTVDRYLQYTPASERLYFNGVYYDRQQQKVTEAWIAANKSIQAIPPSRLLVADYSGFYLMRTGMEPMLVVDEALKAAPMYHLNPFQHPSRVAWIGLKRPSVAYYQSYKHRFWVANNEQLLVIEQGDTLQLRQGQQPIIAFSVASVEDTTYVATTGGLLTFVGKRLTGNLVPTNTPLLSNIRKLVYRDGYLYIGSAQGFQRIHLATRGAQILNRSSGLYSNKIIDFALLEQSVYVLTNKGLQQFPYTCMAKPLPELRADFERVLLKGQPISTDEDGQFYYDQNDLEVYFKVPYLGDRSTLVYRYRLVGLDTNWVELPIGQHQVRYSALGAGAYALEVQALDSRRLESPIARYAFVIAPPFWRTWWFAVLCVLGVTAVVSLFFLIRINILKQQNALLLDKKAVEKQLVESQQTALRAQMNPHFMFNALNSIQEMIVVNNKRAASTYLGKFADLMRLYLNHSQVESVTLAEELEALQLYLELEQVRFEDNLTIDLDIAPNVVPEALTLPPMLLQPYVENAFKHGLLHQTAARHLKITFTLDQGGDDLCCRIQDNGIGRVASAQLKAAQHGYQSFANSATQRRLALLNYNKKNAITVDIEDLTDATGKALGTAVHICIPLDWENE